jgi:hypothetical protein
MKRIVWVFSVTLLIAGQAGAQLARPDEYVVSRRDHGILQEKDLTAVKAFGVHGLEVTARYPRVLGIHAGARVADLLAARGLRVEPNYVYHLDAGWYPEWQLDRVVQRSPWSRTPTPGASAGLPGSFGTLYLLDTYAYDEAGELGDRLVRGPDFVGTDDRSPDCRTHGSWVSDTAAGRLRGLDPTVKVVSLRIVDCASVSSLAVHAALDWMLDEGIGRYGTGVVNMSWGARGFTRNPYELQFQALRQAGLVLVASAGNDNLDASTAGPCIYVDLCAGATNVFDLRAAFSNYGPAIGIFAPGELLATTGPDGQVQRISGTSLSAPLVSAAVLLLENRFPRLSPSRIVALLLANATRDAIGGDLGAGSPNRLLYTGPVVEEAVDGAFQYSGRRKQLTGKLNVALNGGPTVSGWVDFYRRGARGQCKGKPFARGLIDAGGLATVTAHLQAAPPAQSCLVTELGSVFQQKVRRVP